MWKNREENKGDNKQFINDMQMIKRKKKKKSKKQIFLRDKEKDVRRGKRNSI